MYKKHFKLICKPFELVPNPDFLFLSSTHKKAIAYLDYGIKAKIGFILLSGDVGSGKTTIIRNLIKNLDGSIKLSRINYTKVSSEQLIALINKDFGLSVEGKNKTKLLSELNEFLIAQYASGAQPILLVDEAQNLSPDLLEEIRLLSNLETDRAKLLQIILVGQPELKDALMLPELIQLRQRININYHIKPLTIEETSQYIQHRIKVAGNIEAIQLTDDVLEIIYDFSRGIPRLINILCDFALLCAFTKGETEVGFNTVVEVTKDLEANEYWNDMQCKREDVRSGTEGEQQSNKAVADVSARLIRLEESVDRHMSGSDRVQEELKRLEESIARLNAKDDGARFSKVLENLVERMVCRVFVKMTDEDMFDELSERILKIKDMKLSAADSTGTDQVAPALEVHVDDSRH